jgi:hypothetical protein
MWGREGLIIFIPNRDFTRDNCKDKILNYLLKSINISILLFFPSFDLQSKKGGLN